MEELLKLNPEDVKQRVDAKAVRLAKTLQAALTLGPLAFLGVVMVMPAGALAPESAGPELSCDFIRLMVLALGGITLLAVVGAVFLPGLILAPAKLMAQARRALNPEKGAFKDPVAWMLSMHRVVLIIRVASLEGMALFGLVVLMLARQTGFLEGDPLLWSSLVPLLILVLYGAAAFPSRDSITDFLVTHILQPLKRIDPLRGA